jgi:hypothetical protein
MTRLYFPAGTEVIVARLDLILWILGFHPSGVQRPECGALPLFSLFTFRVWHLGPGSFPFALDKCMMLYCDFVSKKCCSSSTVKPLRHFI